MKKKVFSTLMVMALAMTGLFGCGTSGKGANQEKEATQQATNRIVSAVGYPNTDAALVKKMLRLVYELTDRGTDTYTYFRNWNGELRLICPSFGFPSAYSTQFSRPSEAWWLREYKHDSDYDHYILPQAEPDGTYKPGSHSATYYLCKGDTGIYLEYEEATITASKQLKQVVSSDQLVGQGTLLMTFEELEQLKTLEGDALSSFLEGVIDRIEAQAPVR